VLGDPVSTVSEAAESRTNAIRLLIFMGHYDLSWILCGNRWW